MAGGEPIAIVGMAGIYPKAPDKDAFWRNILDRVDAVTAAPPDWRADLFLDPASKANDRVYTDRGGFLGDLAVFDPLRHGVMPSSIDGGEPDQFLALEVAADAVADSGFDQRPVPGERVSVILGRGTYINRGFATVVQHGVMVDRVLEVLRQLNPDSTEAELAEVKKRLKESLPPFTAEMAPALVPNLVTGRISNRLDFRGANYIIDAACASSLIALDRGVADLRSGRCDMAVVGGVHASTPAPIFMIFCQLEALSRKGTIRPFSAEADGTLLAEGVGLLCLKRLSDAEASGDRIYALVRGVGVASDGRGLGILAPRVEGERLAVRRAYEDSAVDPRSVGLIEAHGTATAVGDATEVQALAAEFAGDGSAGASCALGSVKSMIGHCLPAAGSAGLIKAALALHHRVLPPTLIDTPNPDLGIEASPFYLNTEARPWIHGGPEPRRAGVNAFGFGGINAHAVLEEYRGPDAAATQPNVTRTTEVLALDAGTSAELLARIAEICDRLRAPDADLAALARTENRRLGRGNWRAAVVAGTAGDALTRLEKVAERIGQGKTRIGDRSGTYLQADPIGLDGKLAFMFPGEGSQHVGMLRELMLHFPVMRGWFDCVDGAFFGHGRALLPSQVIFPPPLSAEAQAGGGIWRMDIGPEAIFAANQAVAALFDQIGLRPDMAVGHSTGEYSALYAAGVTRRSDLAMLQAEMRALNAVYEAVEREGLIAGGALVAVGAVPPEALLAKIADRDDVFLAMDNCANQQVLAATTPQGRAWAEQMVAELGGFAEVLPFERAYHCPAFQPFSDRLRPFLGEVPISAPAFPVYSCLTAAPFPADPDAIRQLSADQWSGRVRFAETIRQMWEDEARVFLECGPRNNLTAFVNDILRGTPHVAVAVDTPGRTGLEQFHHMVAQLAVAGIDLDPDGFAAPAPAQERAPGRRQRLRMGLQPMRLDGMAPLGNARRDRPAEKPAPIIEVQPERPAALPEPAQPSRSAPAAAEHPVLAAYFDTMARFMDVENDVMKAYLGAAPAAAIQAAPMPLAAAGDRFPMLARTEISGDGRKIVARLEIDLARAPYLADHSFGRGISTLDTRLTGLPVVPLTFTMEALAETAAALRPGLVVTGLREVRASRWLALDRGRLSLEARGEILSEGETVWVRVRLRESDGPPLRPVLVEADVELAAARPPAPAASPLAHGARRGNPWSLDQIYRRIMFHGPRLQAVETMDIATEISVEGNLVGLAHDRLYAATAAPQFETDAITLDAVGQLVGVWSADMLPQSFHIFPFRVERVEIFRDRLATGERGRCRAAIALIGADEMRSDIDVVSADGRLQCRIEGWWDKRFDLPDRFFHARLDPLGASVSRPLALPAGLETTGGLRLSLLDDVSAELLEGSGGIWANVLAHLALSTSERADWQGLAGAEAKRRWDWLRGRVAAKDAVRALVRDLAGLALTASDVELVTSEPDGAPVIGPSWPTARCTPPLVSITHTSGLALALAADPARYAGVGVDAEPVRQHDEAFLATAFPPAQLALIRAAAPESRMRRATECWCAREAAAKAFGSGLGAALSDFEILTPDAAEKGLDLRLITTGEPIRVEFAEDIDPGLVVAIAIRPGSTTRAKGQ